MIIQNIKGHFGPKSLNLKKYPTSNAHNFVIENPNDENFESKFITVKRYTTFVLKVFSFEACIMETEGLEEACFW